MKQEKSEVTISPRIENKHYSSIRLFLVSFYFEKKAIFFFTAKQ
jgi:hypothetical protein